MEPPMRKKDEMDPFEHVFEMMNQFMDNRHLQKFLETIDEYFQHTLRSSCIPINIHETKHEYIISASLPNIEPNQIQLEFTDHHLILSVKNNASTEYSDDKTHLYKKWNSQQNISKTIPLPYPVMEDEIKAAYENGNLIIRLPQKRKYIDIEKRG